MCWNAEVSLNTFLVACFAAIMGLTNGVMNAWGAAFLLTYASMQLLEHFIWKNITDPRMNKILSMIGLTIIMLEAFVSIMCLTETKKYRLRNALLVCFAVFVALLLYWSDCIDFRSSVASNGHLVWHWLTPNLWILMCWMTLFFLPLWFTASHLTFAFMALIVIVSMATFWSAGTWGTMWCWFAGAASVYYIVVSLLKSGSCSSSNISSSRFNLRSKIQTAFTNS